MAEWLYYARDRRIITDEPNACGKPNLEGFVEHRHDQSILTLLKLKYRIEGFRWPSRWGNHFKLPEFRVPGEFLPYPYSDQPYTNSPYSTLVSDEMPPQQPGAKDKMKSLWRKTLFGCIL